MSNAHEEHIKVHQEFLQFMRENGIMQESPTRRFRMSQLLSNRFWRLSAERAVKTAAQTATLLIGAESFDVLTFDWVTLVSMSAGGAVLSLLTSVASVRVGDTEDPSLV